MSKNFSYEDALTPPNAGNAFSYEDATGEKPKRTIGQAIKDTGAQLAEGVNTTLGAIPSVVAPQSKAAGFFRDNADYWRDQQSDVLKGRIAETDKRIAEAGKDGALSQIGTAASEYWNDPAQAARLVATNLPSMAATLGTGAAAGFAAKGVAAARGLDAANKAALAAKYGTTTATATNAALNAGGARGEAFEDLQKSALAQGMTPEQAEQAGVSGSILPGVVGGVAGAISGKIGLEKALLGQATTGAAMRKAAGAFGAELAGEQIEELAPKVATNYQVGQIDAARGLTDDLGRTMVETAIGSGPGAVVAGGAAGMRTGELPPSPGAGDPTTSPGAADPNAPVPPGAAPVEAPGAQTTAPATEEAPSPIQPEAVEPAPLTPEQRMADLEDRMGFIDQQAKANGWDKRLIDARDAAQAELDALRIKPVDIGALDIQLSSTEAPSAGEYYAPGDTTNPLTGERIPDQRPLSRQMGIDPTAGPLSKAAATAVDSGTSQHLQDAQFLGATGRDVQLRQTGPGVTNESNVIDVDAREVPDQRGIPTARRLTNDQDGGARATSSQPLAIPAPTNLREGLERIRAQRQEAARLAQVPPTQGANLVPQAPQAVQTIAQQQEAGNQAPVGAAATTATQPGATGGSGVQAAGVAGAPTIVEVQDNYGRTHRVRQSDLYSNADRIPTVRRNGDVVAGEEIPRSIVKDAPTVAEPPPLDPLGWNPKKLASTYDMAQMNDLYQYLLRNYSNPVVGGGPVENGKATTERFNVEGRKIHAALQQAQTTIYEQSKAKRGSSNQNQAETPVAQAPEATKSAAPAQETTHNGTRIYPTKIKVGDEVKSMWAVESPDNQRRRAAGERTIGGDSLHDTLEQAQAAAEREAKRDAEQQAAKAEQDAADKARKDAEEARKAANRPKTVVERRKDAILDGPSKIAQGTKRAVITSAVDNGYVIEAKMVYDHAAKKRDQEAVDRASRAGYILGVSNENLPLVKAGNEAKARLKEGKYEKPEYRVYQGSDTKAPFREITKTEYDYAQELKAQRASAQQAEAEPAAASQQATDDFLPEGWTKSINGYTKRPVYRMEQGGGQPFAVVTQVEGMQYEVQIRHGDKQLIVSNQTGALSEVLSKAETELTRMTQADSVTHQDPGEKAEAATPGVVTDSLKKAARNEDTKPSEMRKWLVAEIDRAMLDAPEKDATEFVSFDVPGDGVFKVQKSLERLLEFRKKVMASPGFKDGGQKQAKPQQNDSILNGGGTTETIRAFLADGDVQGAVEFAKLKGVEFTPVPPQMKMSADGKGKVKHMPASVKSSVPSVAEGLTRVEAEQINQYLTAESARKEPAATQDADVQPSPQEFIPAPASASPESGSSQGSSNARGQDASVPPTAPEAQPITRADVTEAQQQAPGKRIDDFGETLHGARKMLYAEAYADGMAKAKELDTKAHQLSKTWPEPDYQKLLEDGAPVEAVSLARALREAVPTKPQSAWKLKGWAAKVEALRGFSGDVLSGRLDTKTVEGSMERSGLRGVPNKAALYEAMGHERSMKGIDVSVGRYSMYDRVEYNPPRTIWTVSREAKGSSFGNWPRELAKGDTREAAIAAFKKRSAELLAEEQAPTKGATFEIYSKRAGGAREFFIGKKIGRNVAELKTGFADLKAARQYKADHQGVLEDLLAKYKAVPPVRNTQNAPRIGEDYRKGADVTPAQFQEAFGFRGVQFGNYVEGGRRQQDLNRAYDALMDLAGVLGLQPRALSLGGRLGLAFGARGTGGTDAAAAHYEPTTVVINLTKRDGAGSLAHEWWHGLDNYFSRQRGDGGSYMTSDSRSGDGVREEMRAAFRSVMSAINLTGMQERSRKLDDRRTKEYWTTKPEMSARAFESYVISKLQDQNAGNDYLANVVGDAVFALEGAYPYPTAGELPQIRSAFDAFFQTVETKETEGGNVAMFSRAPAAFSFAGQQAVTADQHARTTAQQRLDAGEDAESVRQETGWFQGKDGKWRYEISDAGAQLAQQVYFAERGKWYPSRFLADARDHGSDTGGTGTLGDVLEHPALFAAYPALRDMPVTAKIRKGQESGAFDGRSITATAENEGRLLSVLLHEIQHGIQNIEGFATGGTPEQFGSVYVEELRQRLKWQAAHLRSAQKNGGIDPVSGEDENTWLALARETANELGKHTGKNDPRYIYGSLAGEVEARNTQARQGMTDEQRRATPPSQTADVADSEVIVVFNGKEMANAPMPANAAQDAATTAQPLRTPAATIRAAITKAYGKLLGQLESKGLVTLTQTQEQAIEAAAQARAAKTGQSVEQARAALRASVKNSVADQTQTENFQRWFKDSKVVDADGKPLVVYHGTNAKFDVFDLSKFGLTDNGWYGKGFYFADDSAVAKRYGKRLIGVYLSLRNPMSADRTGFGEADLQKIIDSVKEVDPRFQPEDWLAADATFENSALSQLERLYTAGAKPELVLSALTQVTGFDGVAMGADGSRVYVAFNPTQIKSAIGNSGAFDPANPDIRRSADGSIQGFFDPQTGQSFLIADNLTAEAAPGVLMHEVGIHMAADGSMKALFNRAAMMLKLQKGNPFMKAVQARMDAAGETSGEEAAAYIAEAYENDRANAPASVQRWLADLLAAVKAWMFKKGIMGANRLTVADIAAVARANARSMARDGGATGGQGFGTAFSRAPAGDQTQTEAFKRWFGDSKVVDADGKPLVVYHGTTSEFNTFRVGNAPGWGRGIYFTNNESVARDEYAGDNGRVVAVYVSLQNPYTGQHITEAQMEATEAGKKVLADGGNVIDASNDDGRFFGSMLRELGYDGVMQKGSNNIDGYEIVAFRPEQIKSATDNNGNFDPTNHDIRFSRATDAAKAVGDTLKSITVSNVKQRAGFKLTDYLGIGLQALGRRQIVDIYGDMLPLDQYNKLVQQMEADKNEGGAEADQLVTRWAKLPDEAKLADLMHDATLAQIDPAKPYVDGDDKARYMTLQGRFNALTDAAKQVYTDTRDSYQAHHAKVRSAIKERIERSELKGPRKAELLKQMDDEFFAAVKGVYFPLARFGQYAVTVKGADGKVESVSRAETKAEAEALRNSLLSAFPRDKGFTVGRVMLSKDFIADRDAVGRGFMTELYQVLDKQDMDAAQRAELEDTLGQLYLSSLPDLSWAKHGIHRKGTPGFSQDARRAFAQNMFHGARYLAKLRYSDLMQDELAAMQRHVDDWREVEDFDQNSAQRVVDEMNKRHESLMNPKSNPLSTALTSFGFIFHLGLSPASAMVNLSQTALVAYPIMGAKWGFNKASAALLKASAEAAKGKNDITASLNADELAAYNEAVRAGTIDVTMAHDLAGIAQGEDAGVMWKIRPVMRWASFLFHHAERFNRQVTFVAAYRLAREAGADHKAAFEQATKATYDGHFDYGAANRPRIMQGNVAKVLLLFKQYGQNMVYTLTRSAQQSLKGATPEARAQARKALGGLLAMHAMAAGVLGLPMVTTLLAAASMIGGDDDEPWDAKVALQNLLADTFGQKPAEVLAHGLSRLTPWDISGRVGLDKLIFPDVQEGLEGQRLAESAMTAALGPVAGIGINVLKGLQEMSDGRYLRGLETMAPSVARGPLKALRYGGEGVKDKSGIVVQDEVDAAALWGQAAGFSPSSVRNAYEGKSAIVSHDRALQARRSSLVEQFAMAAMAKDEEGKAEAREAIAKFNEKNPNRRIQPMHLAQSVAMRQKRIREAQDGVYLPTKRRDAADVGRFAFAGAE